MGLKLALVQEACIARRGPAGLKRNLFFDSGELGSHKIMGATPRNDYARSLPATLKPAFSASKKINLWLLKQTEAIEKQGTEHPSYVHVLSRTKK